MISPRALTLWPEWAWAIESLDKRVENRTWPIPPAMIGATVYLHAGSEAPASVHRQRREQVQQMAARAGWFPPPWDLFSSGPRVGTMKHNDGRVALGAICQGMRVGGIIGKMRFLACDPPGQGDLTGWRAPEQFGWRFEYEGLPFPVPHKGALGFWTPTVVVGRA